MRGALFNMLGDIDGLTVLDAFAGSGALSFEALSRGASSATAIESDRNAQKTITENSKVLALGTQVKLVKATSNAWFSTNGGRTFDLLLCDPPYDNLQLPLIVRLAGAVKPGGLLVLSWPGSDVLPEITGLTLIENRSYGDSQLGFYRR